MKKLLIILALFSLTFGFAGVGYAFAQGEVKAEFDSSLKAFVDIDNFSTLQVQPSNNERGLESDVVARILDRNGNPLPNHTIFFYTLDSSENVVFVQPSVSNSDGYAIGKVKAMQEGVYVIRAYDATYPEGDISLYSTDTLYAFPLHVPVLSQEPYYTKGLNNRLYWDAISGDGDYEYYLEVATDSLFGNIVSNSGWLASLDYEFQNLQTGKMYFYRIKARNQGGGESSWSSTQFSVQDDVPPLIKLISVGKLESSGNIVSLNIKFQITDDLALEKISFFCVRSNDVWQECGTVENSGSVYTVSVPLSDLERGPLFSLFDEYQFCVEAFDKAGNRSQNCDARVILEELIDTPVPVFTNIINSIIKKINDGLQNLENRVITILSSTRFIILDIFSLLLMLVFVFLTLFALTGSFMLMPTLILLLFLKLLNFFGIRGHGKPLGIVYDAVSKKPIKWAVVHIYDSMNRLVRKDITNRAGEFFGNLNVGRYRIIVHRSSYLYPSQLVKGKEDRKLGNVYKGEYFNVSKNKEVNIVVPLDPVNLKNPGEVSLWESRKAGFVKSFALLALVVGFSLSTYVFQQSPSFFRMFVLLLYIPIIGVYIKSIVPIKWRVG